MVIRILQIYMMIIITLSMMFAIRHLIFSFSRLLFRQKGYYQDIFTNSLPYITVLIPMHNEEAVLDNVMKALLKCDYESDRLEIIAINDHSDDGTQKKLEKYKEQYDFIKILERTDENSVGRGKPAGLNDAMKIAKGDVIVVFDADYRPAKDLLRQLALAFEDPGVGAVMGRVIPYNVNKNVLTRLLNIERSGGYQVDQQARYNLGLIPQYGGTVGGFRKDLIVKSGGFDTRVLAEDTELTYRLYTMGYRVVYANSAECYEESPETYEARGKQIRRWARGHNQVMFRYLPKIFTTPYLGFWQRIDAFMLSIVYMMPFLFLIGRIVAIILFFENGMAMMLPWMIFIFLSVYASFGNFAPFFQIGTALLLDGMWGEILLLPLLIFHFFFYMWHISLGFIDAVIDLFSKGDVEWEKTARFYDASEGDDLSDDEK